MKNVTCQIFRQHIKVLTKMKFSKNFGFFNQVNAFSSWKGIHKVPPRTNHVKVKALEQCRKAGESMKKITESFNVKSKMNSKPGIFEHNDWIQHLMMRVGGDKNLKKIFEDVYLRNDDVQSIVLAKEVDPCKMAAGGDPCKDPCKKKEDPCKKKEDPCKKKEDPCKKKEDPCKKKEDPCKKKEDPCKKKEDPCKKKEDPCKKKEDPCKKKEDPCKKKEDPCKKKEDPCKKKQDPCKKKEDPCKKKEDPCKKKEDPCKKKDDPCKKSSTKKLCTPPDSTPKSCSGAKLENEGPDIFYEVKLLDPDKMYSSVKTPDPYQNKEYHSYTNTAYYDLNNFLSDKRQAQPSNKKKDK